MTGAAEMRAIAEWMLHPETAAIIAQLADDYDKLADRAEARSKDAPKRH